QEKVSLDGCLKKEQMAVSAIVSTPHSEKIREQLTQVSGRKQHKYGLNCCDMSLCDGYSNFQIKLNY
ncbi:hypothetical protein POX82_22630, partial [Escherichia coli]